MSRHRLFSDPSTRDRPRADSTPSGRPDRLVSGTPDSAPSGRPDRLVSGTPDQGTSARLPWRSARRRIATVAALPVISVPPESAVGGKLAGPIVVQGNLPPQDCAESSGYAVAGFGPWTLLPGGLREGEALPDGQAVLLAAGAALPPGCSAVIDRRRVVLEETSSGWWVLVADEFGRPSATPGRIDSGTGIRLRESIAVAGQRTLSEGGLVTPAMVALAAACGQDDLAVIPPPTVEVLRVKDPGTTRTGPSRAGRLRDVVADLLPAWVDQSPARRLPTRDVPADPSALVAAVRDSPADIVLLSSGMTEGRHPTVVEALERIPGQAMVQGVRLTPGGEGSILAIDDERYLLTLPGGPMAAAAAMCVLFDPLVAALSGEPGSATPVEALFVVHATPGPWADPTPRLVPVVVESGDLALRAHPLGWTGPDGMQGLAAADGLAVIDQRAESSGGLVPVLPLPGVLLG